MSSNTAETGTFTMAVAQHAPIPIALIEPDGRIRYANPALHRLLGIPDSSMTNTLFHATLDIGSRAKCRLLYASAQEAPNTAFEINQLNSQGDVVTVAYRATPHEQHILLFGELREQVVATTQRLLELNQRLQALYRLATSAADSLEITTIFTHSLETLVSELRLSAAAIVLNTADGARVVAEHGFSGLKQRIDAGWFRQELGLTNQRLYLLEGEAKELGLEPTNVPQAIDTYWHIALSRIGTEQAPIGTLIALTEHFRGFGEEEHHVLRICGDLLAPRINNARLFTSLRERTSQLQSVLDGIETGILLTDTSGIVRIANRSLGHVLNTSTAHWAGQLREDVLPEWALAASSHAPGHPLLTPDQRALRWTSNTIRDANEVLIGQIDIFDDITESQRMTQLKDDFVAAAAHDLKTPVTAIKGYAQIALRFGTQNADPRLVKQLAIINALSDELSVHMEGLLDMSRLQAGRMVLHLESTELQPIVDRTTKYIENPLLRQQRPLYIHLPEQPIHVYWDPLRIERVLINLVVNAIKYSPSNQPVQIDVCELGDVVEIVVSDHGIGIPAEERQHVFERFYRTQQARAEGFRGTGLGLFICREIVVAHGGTIHVEAARHGGQGISVVVCLPCRAPELASEAA